MDDEEHWSVLLRASPCKNATHVWLDELLHWMKETGPKADHMTYNNVHTQPVISYCSLTTLLLWCAIIAVSISTDQRCQAGILRPSRLPK